MTRQRKSAWLGAAEADSDYQPRNERSLPAVDETVNAAPNPPELPKDYATMRALFALRGRVLTRSHRVPDGRITFVVTSWAGARYFSHLHDVQWHLSQITERATHYPRRSGDGL